HLNEQTNTLTFTEKFCRSIKRQQLEASGGILDDGVSRTWHKKKSGGFDTMQLLPVAEASMKNQRPSRFKPDSLCRKPKGRKPREARVSDPELNGGDHEDKRSSIELSDEQLRRIEQAFNSVFGTSDEVEGAD